MWFHLTDKATGAEQTVATLDGYDPDLFDIVELGREPGEFDDVVGGVLVTNAKRQADALAGPEHIAEAHMQKRIEAALIASGVPLTKGLLFEEANALGVPLESLAAEVMTKSAEFAAVELTRKEQGK